MQTCLNLRLGAVGVLVKHSETQLSSVLVRYDIIYLQGYSGFFWGSGRITYTNHLRECLVLIPNNTAIFACQKGCSLLLIGSHFQQFKLFPLYFFSFLINFFFFFFFCHTVVACGILVPWPGIESMPPALEVQALTTGPSRKSPFHWISE